MPDLHDFTGPTGTSWDIGDFFSTFSSIFSSFTSQFISFSDTGNVSTPEVGKADLVKGVVNAVKNALNSRQARRETMRQEKIPTSQQPISQSKNQSGREYKYEVPKKGGGIETKSVQQQTLDRSHPGEKHWEAGSIKVDGDGNIQTNKYGFPKLENNKSKVDYE
ncbi:MULTISPECIES: hypothetical protein [Methylomicrobium]|uniref:hypothetical protein n=1 Tax=Methylomicrobium TaxID=39773 RepID=UPI001BC887E8|nr:MULTISPECIES: hypothetical protein [Methylomicrobium]